MPYLPKRAKNRAKEPWGKSTNQTFYNSKVWRTLRKKYISQYPLCAAHEAADLIVPATVVDHVIPMSAGGAKLSTRNLQSLCAECHNRKSAMEQHLVIELIMSFEGAMPTQFGREKVINELNRFI